MQASNEETLGLNFESRLWFRPILLSTYFFWTSNYTKLCNWRRICVKNSCVLCRTHENIAEKFSQNSDFLLKICTDVTFVRCFLSQNCGSNYTILCNWRRICAILAKRISICAFESLYGKWKFWIKMVAILWGNHKFCHVATIIPNFFSKILNIIKYKTEQKFLFYV